MSSTSDMHGDTRNAVPSLTSQRIAQQLSDAGHAVHGGIYADERGVAWLIACTPRTLRSWRANGSGPPATRTVRWLYSLDELCAWLQSRSSTNLPEKPGNKRKNAAR
jgi:hypothetical protein